MCQSSGAEIREWDDAPQAGPCMVSSMLKRVEVLGVLVLNQSESNNKQELEYLQPCNKSDNIWQPL